MNRNKHKITGNPSYEPTTYVIYGDDTARGTQPVRVMKGDVPRDATWLTAETVADAEQYAGQRRADIAAATRPMTEQERAGFADSLAFAERYIRKHVGTIPDTVELRWMNSILDQYYGWTSWSSDVVAINMTEYADTKSPAGRNIFGLSVISHEVAHLSGDRKPTPYSKVEQQLGEVCVQSFVLGGFLKSRFGHSWGGYLGKIDANRGVEEAFAEGLAASCRQECFESYRQYGDSHHLVTRQAIKLPVKYWILPEEYVPGNDESYEQDGRVMSSAYLAYALDLVTQASGVDMHELLRQMRQEGADLPVLQRSFIRTLEGIDKGLYAQFRDADYTEEGFSKVLRSVAAALKKDVSGVRCQRMSAPALDSECGYGDLDEGEEY